MVNVRLVLEYDGTYYYGWQVQPEVPTIQGELQKALVKILKQKVSVVGAARTDRGVHAKGQVVSTRIPNSFPVTRLAPALNSVLPLDIRIKEARQVKDSFHARYDARYKVYKYFICNSLIFHPWLRKYSWWVTSSLDCQRMKKAASYLIGKHDFSSFQNEGSPSTQPVKCVEQLRIHKRGSLISLSIKADSFLYRMARNITGTLVEVGRGKLSPLQVKELLLAKDRRKAGPTAPPQGLFLWRIEYAGDN